MLSRLAPIVGTLVVTASLGLGAPAAGASTGSTDHSSIRTGLVPSPALPTGALAVPAGAAGACGEATGGELQGRPGGSVTQVCGGLSFIGPSIGQIDSNIGPTIISPGVAGAAIVTGNNVVVAP